MNNLHKRKPRINFSFKVTGNKFKFKNSKFSNYKDLNSVQKTYRIIPENQKDPFLGQPQRNQAPAKTTESNQHITEVPQKTTNSL